MADIIDLHEKRRSKLPKETLRLYTFGTELDKLFIQHLSDGAKQSDLAVVCAHRLGELLRTLDENIKDDIIDLSVDVLLKRSGVNDV